MFQKQEYACLDPKYFHIIVKGERDITIQSKNTGHYWYLQSTGASGSLAVLIYHKHRCSHPYHRHGQSTSLAAAIRAIERHDRWKLARDGAAGVQKQAAAQGS